MSVVICMVAAMIAGVVPAVRRTVVLADGAVGERMRAEVERQILVASAKSLRSVAALLSDEVALALRACSLPREAMSEGRVLDQCRAAPRALDLAAQYQYDDPTERGLITRIADVVAGSPLVVRVQAARVADPPVPAPVMAAIAAGVGTALRNVDKQAGIGCAAILIGPSDAGCSELADAVDSTAADSLSRTGLPARSQWALSATSQLRATAWLHCARAAPTGAVQ